MNKAVFMNITDNPDNVRKMDRILILRPADGKATSTKGAVDHRLFTGTNKLHAVHDEQYNLWHLKYDSGVLPQPLQQQFTSFVKLLAFVIEYYKRRNVEIVEVQD